MNFRGLGLPTDQFATFVNLLAVITNGEATCGEWKGGYCVLANPCAHYTASGLWNYDFKIMFSSDTVTGNYIRVPLATFSNNYAQEDGICVIFVEYLNKYSNEGESILFGSMFLQSIYL